MSMELERSSGLTPKSHKKPKDKAESKVEKKRKRDAQDDTEPSPSKRHHSEKNPRPSAAPIDLSKVAGSPGDSPFYLQTSSLYLPLSPIAQLHPVQGLCAEHLSPLILTYYPPFHGVVLSYSNARLSEDPNRSGAGSLGEKVLAQSIAEYAVSYVWVTAEFLIFKPQRGGWIEGWINLQNEGHLGLVCWNLFNASIDRKRLPKEWRWVAGGMDGRRKSSLKNRGGGSDIEDTEQQDGAYGVEEVEGHFEDAEGQKIEGRFRFRVKNVEPSLTSEREKGFLSIEGTMLNDEEEKELLEQEINKVRRRGAGPLGRRMQSDHIMAGALGNGQLDGVGAEDVDRLWSAKHRVTY